MENKITIDFSEERGKVKPMHAVNNGPVYKYSPSQRLTNIVEYKEAGIPFTRNHDASLYYIYGGAHTVDVNYIFTDFDADENDPASYDFASTDEYVRVTYAAGSEIYYRLGSSIEHYLRKYNTLPPKDFAKWARVCEHIIRHYNEGWANGFRYGITYWEVWNEPELDLDKEDKRCWGGTAEQFYELFNITVKHLKACFGDSIKVGGPASAAAWRDGFAEGLFEHLETPIDFYSWHRYTNDPKNIAENIKLVREKLNALGYKKTESILNEWNYISGWLGEEFERSVVAGQGLKGSAFISAVLCVGQENDVDMLMYYDARPGEFNGLFEANTNKPLKGYYSLHMFNRLYRLGTSVKSESFHDDLYVTAAKNAEGEGAILVSHFNDDDKTYSKDVTVEVKGAAVGKKGVRTEYYMLDAYRTETPIAEYFHESGDFSDVIPMTDYATCLVRVTPV